MKKLRCLTLTRRTNRNIEPLIKEFFFWTLGSIMFAVAIDAFTAPNNITAGGFSGIATALNYLFGVPIGLCVFLLNAPFFILSFLKFGYKFIIKTVVATFEVSFFIDILAPILSGYSSDRLLCSVFGGLLLGSGLGLIFRNSATTGGTDIIAKLLRLKYPHLSMGRMILIVDVIIVISCAFVFRDAEGVLYALVTIFMSTQAVDLISSGLSHSKTVLIVTEHGDEITEKIIHELDRGVTVVNAYGGYTKNDKQVLLCAVRANDIPHFSKIIRQADESSFMVVTDADDILGNGFEERNI